MIGRGGRRALLGGSGAAVTIAAIAGAIPATAAPAGGEILAVGRRLRALMDRHAALDRASAKLADAEKRAQIGRQMEMIWSDAYALQSEVLSMSPDTPGDVAMLAVSILDLCGRASVNELSPDDCDDMIDDMARGALEIALWACARAKIEPDSISWGEVSWFRDKLDCGSLLD